MERIINTVLGIFSKRLNERLSANYEEAETSGIHYQPIKIVYINI